MKNVVCALAILLAGCAIKGSAGSAEAPAPEVDAARPPDAAIVGPRMAWSEVLHDAGEVTAGEQIKHTFIVRNVGTDVLHIRRAKGS